MIMFTGSTATGKKILTKAAETLTPVAGAGGKDPMIVLSDADVERAANAAVFYGMQNSGQTCISTERVYVEEGVYDEFVTEGRHEGRRAAPGPFGRDRARSRSGR
jgi:acyl-CoA reductase-like NAD-dependent aldehyde dehydrogenase